MISIVARLAALGALVVGLSRSDAPVPFIGLTGVGLLAVLISSAIVQRETDQVGWRLRMLGLSKQQADLEHALARTGVDGKECPTRRELIKDWVYLIAGVVASCGASIAIAVVIYVAGPGEHQDLRDPEIISAVLSSTGLVAVTWALTVVIGYRGRVRNAKPWGAVLEVIAYSFAVLTTALLGGVVLLSWTDDWFWMVMMGVTAAVGSSLGYLGVRGRGPYRVARTSAIAAIHRDLAQVSASLSDVGNRIRQTPTSGVEPRLDPGLTKSPAAGQGTI